MGDGRMEYMLKLKGMTLHTLTTKQINFTSIVDLVKNSVLDDAVVAPISVDQKTFRRSVDGIRTEYLKKKYRIVYKKRRIINEFETQPWGWVSEKK